MLKVRNESKKPVRERIYTHIREWIILGVLKPGEKISDLEFANEMGVSRTPVREAFRRLEDEGFIETYAYQWTKVSHIDMNNVKSIYKLIWELETLCFKLAGNGIKALDVSGLKHCNENISTAIEAQDIVEIVKLDSDFHNFFISASENKELIKILTSLKLKLHRYEIMYFTNFDSAVKSRDEHSEIIHQIQKKDFNNAKRMLRKHWKNCLKRGTFILRSN